MKPQNINEITKAFHDENDDLIRMIRDRFKFFADHGDKVSRDFLIREIKGILRTQGVDDLCCIVGQGRCYMEAGE